MNAAKQIIAGVMIYFTVIGQVFGQAALLPNAEQQYFDNNGHPLASGTVTYYVPGTTTKKTTWLNSTQTVNNTNPVALDIGGKGIMYGQGSYRQVVQDNLGNVIWDQPTTAYGASSPSGATGTDTAPVGTVLPYSGFVVPTNWQLAYGQALSRTTFAALEAAITISAPGVSCINTSTTMTGFTDTSLIRIGAPIEATCLPTSTTVASITNATTIVVSQAAAATSTVTATIFPWGNGDQVSTFNVPDLRGRAPVGADCMGYVASGNTCAGNLTSTYYGSNPGAAGQKGGTQSKTIAQTNLPNVNFTVSGITLNDPGHSHTASSNFRMGDSTTAGALPYAGSVDNSTFSAVNVTVNTATTGITISSQGQAASGGSGTAISAVNPDATVNYIIKVSPNNTGAGGVVSLGGMFGDIVCASTLTCAPIGNVNTVGCTTATISQLGCVQPDGTSITIVGGVISANAAVASSVVIGSTAITGGSNTDILYDNGGVLGQLTPSGTGSVCMTVNCVMTTPTLGAASAASINKVAITSPASSATLTIANGKTLTANNSLTLTGTDSTSFAFPGTNDTVAGLAATQTLTNKTFNCANNTCTVRLGSDVTGQLPIANGGTGQATQQAAIIALLPTATRAGDIIYWDGTNWNHLAGNNSGTQVLQETASGVPSWATVSGTGTVTSMAYIASTGINISGTTPCTTTCTWTFSNTGVTSIAAGAGISSTGGSTPTLSVNQSVLTTSLGSNTAIATGSFTDGPGVATGATGTWWFSGSVTIGDTAGAAQIKCKLWDGATVIASGDGTVPGASTFVVIALSGYLASPASTTRISCQDITSSSGFFAFNQTGASKDSTLSAHRVQ